MEPVLKVLRLRPEDGDLPEPRYMSEGAAGLDLAAAVASPVALAPGARALVPTGIAIEIPPGYEAQVRPRSGLAIRHGITMVNSPGTVDSDFRGEIQVPMINLGTEPFEIRRGERIAQMVIAPVARARIEMVRSLSTTARGENGFGSSGR